MNRFAAGIVSVALLSLTGCDKSASTSPTPTGQGTAPAAERSDIFVPKAAQPKLPTIKLWVGPEELESEVAMTPIQQATGMMFRTNMPENTAMLFIRPAPEQASFWMTNCPLPLAAAYIDPEGVILETHELKANDPTPVQSSAYNVQFVLEVNSGWFQRHHITTGTLISTEHGSLPQIFLRRR